MDKCNYCKEKLENCICSLVAKFFTDNGHLIMDKKTGLRKEQLHKKKFFYVKGLSLLVNH
jgi:hypothetical protein